jgi:hypothetical protein
VGQASADKESERAAIIRICDSRLYDVEEVGRWRNIDCLHTKKCCHICTIGATGGGGDRTMKSGRYEFMLVIAPLKVVGGTGSPVNPLALF